MTYFYDSGPGEFPRGAQYAALYADSSLEVGYHPQRNPGIPNTRWITRRGGADAAAYAGIADYEAHNTVYGGELLGQWARSRSDRSMLARVYCSMSDVRLAWPQVIGLGNVWWWIPTGDGRPSWTPAEIVAAVHHYSGVTLPVARIWGIQWGWGPQWDTSTLTADW